MKRFLGWIILFLLSLGLIPILFNSELSFFAKIAGFIVLLAIIVALRVWGYQTKSKSPRNERFRFNKNDIFWIEKHIPFYSLLKKQDKQIFLDRMGLFIAHIKITEIDKEITENSTKFYVAASAVIAYWGLPYWNYGNLSEVLVYPSNFNDDQTLKSFGAIQGKVFHGGLMDNTIILSRPALIAGFQIGNDKKNVGVHEFAHLLDKADGDIDGVPNIVLGENDRKIWLKVMQQEMEKWQQKKSTIPPYALKSEAEFFAVVTEYFKECPKLLKHKNPELFEVLVKIYGEPPNC
ncbi:MAG: zinc-dependent peptidase [Crocinitomicaceae bacterium]|nr:zinc-dependent peptidase [Crocinitomicaceae bacterium]